MVSLRALVESFLRAFDRAAWESVLEGLIRFSPSGLTIGRFTLKIEIILRDLIYRRQRLAVFLNPTDGILNCTLNGILKGILDYIPNGVSAGTHWLIR